MDAPSYRVASSQLKIDKIFTFQNMIYISNYGWQTKIVKMISLVAGKYLKYF